MARRDKTNYYLDLADVVSKRGTCLRRHYGAVIVKNDEVISTGYVGAPRGRKNCSDLGRCIRQEMEIPRGERYELCRSVHAEANAIISAEREKMVIRYYMKPAPTVDMLGGQAPALIGSWVGARIIASYMKKHKDLKIKDLLELTDYQSMFEESGYLKL